MYVHKKPHEGMVVHKRSICKYVRIFFVVAHACFPLLMCGVVIAHTLRVCAFCIEVCACVCVRLHACAHLCARVCVRVCACGACMCVRTCVGVCARAWAFSVNLLVVCVCVCGACSFMHVALRPERPSGACTGVYARARLFSCMWCACAVVRVCLFAICACCAPLRRMHAPVCARVPKRTHRKWKNSRKKNAETQHWKRVNALERCGGSQQLGARADACTRARASSCWCTSMCA